MQWIRNKTKRVAKFPFGDIKAGKSVPVDDYWVAHFFLHLFKDMHPAEIEILFSRFHEFNPEWSKDEWLNGFEVVNPVDEGQ